MRNTAIRGALSVPFKRCAKSHNRSGTQGFSVGCVSWSHFSKIIRRRYMDSDISQSDDA